MRAQRDAALYALGLEPGTAELDHDPALCLREYDPETQRYTPDANDPKFLVNRKEFAESKGKVLDVLAGLVGTTPEALGRAA